MFKKAKGVLFSSLMSVIALVAVNGGIGPNCFFIIHEPEIPEVLKSQVRS